MRKKKKPITVAVSGGFDPLHVGHVRLLESARRLGDQLVVILNNDYWLTAKKGRPFMNQRERKEILESLRCVDRVVLTSHGKHPRDMGVARELLKICPNIFANGGDRKQKGANQKQIEACRRIGCQMLYGVGGGKIQSSSWLLKKSGLRS